MLKKKYWDVIWCTCYIYIIHNVPFTSLLYCLYARSVPSQSNINNGTMNPWYSCPPTVIKSGKVPIGSKQTEVVIGLVVVWMDGQTVCYNMSRQQSLKKCFGNIGSKSASEFNQQMWIRDVYPHWTTQKIRLSFW